VASEPDQNIAPRAILMGIGFMFLAALTLPFLNTSAKYLAAEIAVWQIVWARYTGHMVYMLALFGPRRGIGLFATRRPGLQLARSALLLGATVCYFTALKNVSVPLAAAIGFTSPLIVTVLAVPLLGESVGIRRWIAVGVGFAGALVVIRPGLGHVHWSAVLVLGSAACYALYQILTRRVSAYDDAQTSITYTALVGTAATSLALPWVWQAPATSVQWLLLAGLGAFAGTGHYFVVRAFQQGPASVISPFNYLQLLGATALGYVVFGDVPDAWTWTGAAMIVGSGIYVTYRESRRRRA
jgi:drug/metabolite transporter (DMT)-like permease